MFRAPNELSWCEAFDGGLDRSFCGVTQLESCKLLNYDAYECMPARRPHPTASRALGPRYSTSRIRPGQRNASSAAWRWPAAVDLSARGT